MAIKIKLQEPVLFYPSQITANPVCPHAGGVGLCEYVEHLAMIDFICISGTLENRLLEYVDHLHEHFRNPGKNQKGCFMPPEKPGYRIEMKTESPRDYLYPTGSIWEKLSVVSPQ